jgi:hypothetical protein
MVRRQRTRVRFPAAPRDDGPYESGMGILKSFKGPGRPMRLFVGEDNRCDPADAVGVGDRVAESDDHSGCSVHQRRAQVDDRAPEYWP